MECYKVHSMGSLLKYSCQFGCVCCAVSSLLSVCGLWQDAVQTVNVGSGDKLGCRQPWRSKWVRKQGSFVTSWNVLCWWPPSSFWVGTQGTSRLDYHGRVDFEMVLKLWKKLIHICGLDCYAVVFQYCVLILQFMLWENKSSFYFLILLST